MNDQDTTYTAPILPSDWYYDGSAIWPCHDCLPWHIDIVTDPDDGSTVVREWHAVGCSYWTRIGVDDGT